MEFLTIMTLLIIDIAIGLCASFREEMKPKPLTFLEFFNFMYDEKQEIIRILEEQNEQTRKKMFDQYLNLKDQMRRKDEKNT